MAIKINANKIFQEEQSFSTKKRYVLFCEPWPMAKRESWRTERKTIQRRTWNAQATLGWAAGIISVVTEAYSTVVLAEALPNNRDQDISRCLHKPSTELPPFSVLNSGTADTRSCCRKRFLENMPFTSKREQTTTTTTTTTTNISLWKGLFARKRFQQQLLVKLSPFFPDKDRRLTAGSDKIVKEKEEVFIKNDPDKSKLSIEQQLRSSAVPNMLEKRERFVLGWHMYKLTQKMFFNLPWARETLLKRGREKQIETAIW